MQVIMSSHDPTPITRLNGLRVLIVEDEAMVAILLEDILADCGCAVIGRAFSVEEAIALTRSERQIGAAILDVNLRGSPIYPVAEVLAARGIPFAFASGYGAEGLDEKWRDRLSLPKPFTSQ